MAPACSQLLAASPMTMSILGHQVNFNSLFIYRGGCPRPHRYFTHSHFLQALFCSVVVRTSHFLLLYVKYDVASSCATAPSRILNIEPMSSALEVIRSIDERLRELQAEARGSHILQHMPLSNIMCGTEISLISPGATCYP